MFYKYLFLFIPGKKTGLILSAILYGMTAFAQVPGKITGHVTDEQNQSLQGVTVVIGGSTNGTTTDAQGNYSLQVPGSADSLMFSYVGFESMHIAVRGRQVINVTMRSSAAALQGVVVIGYGTQSRADVTTSISKLDDKVLQNVPYSNAAAAMEGTLPGVRVQTTSGQPGAQPRVIIRGGTSINNPNGAAPLYVIDGVIKPNMNDVSAEDIASLQVLKDAASTAIYGARGSNGVVLITTKSGKAGQTRVTYNYDLTFSDVSRRYKMASARDFIYYSRIGIATSQERHPSGGGYTTLTDASGAGTGNDLTDKTFYTTQYLTPENKHKLDEGWESMPDPLDSSKTIIFKGTDWQDVLFQTGVSHNHHVAISGGSDKATFNAGVGYFSNEGVAITTKYKRLSFDLNGTIKVRDNLNFTGHAMYSNSKDNEVYNISQVFFRSVGMAPTAKYAFEDGTIAPGFQKSIGNPAYYLYKDKRDNNTDRLTISLAGHWGILPGFSFDPQVSLYKVTGDNYAFTPAYQSAGTYNTSRNASSAYSKQIQYQADAVFSYDHTFASAHNLDVKAGFSYYERGTFGLSASGQGAATDLIPTLNASALPVSVNGSLSDQLILGYFGRINYNYKQKYLLSLSSRYDGASNLGLVKWGFFPGISAGWNLYNENFWNSVFPNNVFQLKLRASYGVNGNISGLSDFAAQGEYGVGRRYLDQPAIENTVIANATLRWEQSQTADVGADIGLFDRRVNIQVDYYSRVTKNLLTNLTLPPSTGFSSIFTNLGSLGNKGFEVDLGVQVLPSSSAFQWDISFNAAYTKSKILHLPPNGTENNRVGGFFVWDDKKQDYAWKGGLQEGGTMGDFYAWKQIGIYPTDKDAASAPFDATMPYEDHTKYGGDAEYLDADHNDTIDTRDLVYMGNPYPKWTGGMTNTISYKNLSLTVRMDYMTGYTIYNRAKVFLSGQWAGNLSFPEDMVTKGWHKPGDIATYTQYVPGTPNYSYWRGSAAYGNLNNNSIFYEAGDFLCIREVTLSYNLPGTLLQKIGLHDIRLNVTGSNLYYFTKYDGMNPEDGGVDDGRYPLPRNITFGASISF